MEPGIEISSCSDSCLNINEGVHRSTHRKTELDLISTLCMQCQKLDLDASFDESSEKFERVKNGSVVRPKDACKIPDGDLYFYDDAILVHLFQERLSKPSDCPLCTFFRSLRVQPEVHERYKLLAFRSSDSWLYRGDWVQESGFCETRKDTVFMSVVPDIKSLPRCGYGVKWLDYDIPATGAMYCLRDGELPCSEEPKLLCARELGDGPTRWFDDVRELLNLCRSKHGKACRRRASHESISRGFRLINCTKSPVVVEDKPWGTAYAALSYVWGSRPEDGKDWPQTVLDGVEVTRELGLQYLWVDRHCINQSDTAERQYLISRMTTIYEAAEFTIVAAAGSGASHGLPGVRSTRRRPQPKYSLLTVEACCSRCFEILASTFSSHNTGPGVGPIKKARFPTDTSSSQTNKSIGNVAAWLLKRALT